jgi:hypothetical protein
LIHGTVINLTAFGATVRLESGELASAPAQDVAAHRLVYERALSAKKSVQFEQRAGRRPTVVLAPQIAEPELDAKITSYLKETAEWEPAEGPSTHERHFLHKKIRAERRNG